MIIVLMTTEFHAKPGYYYIIGSIKCPGVASFMYRVEHELFNNESEYEEIDILICIFEGIKYIVLGFPQELMDSAKNISNELGLEIKPGRPTVINTINEKRVFSFSCSEDCIYNLQLSKSLDISSHDLNKILMQEAKNLRFPRNPFNQ